MIMAMMRLFNSCYDNYKMFNNDNNNEDKV